jgi:GNAT superfamily N-acetyltransferase
MQSAVVSWFKRYKMEVDLAGLPRPVWPAGFRPIAWHPDLLGLHADVLFQCFHGEVDSVVFPSLGNRDGCAGLMAEIARRRAFIPEATWLLMGPDGPCGTVQALRERGALGAIQNIGVIPSHRKRRLGEALLLQALHGMYDSGLGRAVLEVTAQNDSAIRLYKRLGFRRTRVVYKAVSALSTNETSLLL